MLSKGFRETESILIAVQNNAMRTNYIEARIDKMQQNSKWRLCGDRDETINPIISECCKFAQKDNKTRKDWVGKVFPREMCKKLKFDHTNKLYMHNTASVLENNTYKVLLDFEIETDHLILARRPDFINNIIINNNDNKKRTYKIVDFAVPVDNRIKLKGSEKKNKYLDLARQLKKLWNMKVEIIPIVIDAFGTVIWIIRGTGEIGSWRASGDHPIYYIWNTEMSPGDLRSLVVTQIPVKDHQLKLM